MKKWQMESITLKNLGPFLEERTLSFLAPSKEKNDFVDNQESIFLNKIKYKFNNIIGIFGPNASGKTQLLEAFKNYLKYNSLDPIIHKESMDYFYFSKNNHKESSEIKVKYISEEGFIIHIISFSNIEDMVNIPDNTVYKLSNKFSEKIIFIGLDNKEQVIFDNSNLNYLNNLFHYKTTFIETFNFQVNIENHSIEDGFLKRKQKEFYELISTNFINSDPFKIEIPQNWDSNASNTIRELITSSLNFVYVNNSNKLDKALIAKNYQQVEKILEEVKIFITKIAKICEPNVEKINFNLSINPYNHFYDIKNIYVVYEESDIGHRISSLSSGTLTLMITLLRMYSDVKVNKNALFIFDELGKSWHSQLLINFLVFYATTPIFKNTKIIFTSHHPESADILRTDATWLISKDHQLNSLYSFKGEEGNTYKRNKFSKLYNDAIVDTFLTSPSITEFENIERYFELND